MNMPSLYNLNSPPHPFWDFVASLDEATSAHQAPNQAGNQQHTARSSAESSKKRDSDKQPTVEDEVAAESSSQEKGKAPEATGQPSREDQQIPFRGRGRCGGNGAAHRGPVHGHRGGRGAFGGPYHHHPPGEGFDGFGDFNPFGGFGLFGPQHRRPSPPHGTHGGSHPQHNRPEPCRPPHSHHHRGRGPRGGPNNFNLGEFLSNLGSRLGLDLSGAAEGLGLGLDHRAGLADGVDFEPRADIFDTPASYLIHLSLPGAKKEDLGVDWDGEHSILRIGGVVHRPGIDEETLKLLAVDGRKKEVGVFEKKIHLGTKKDPAKIDVAGITAKMIDGVLIVKVPKVEVEHVKREVRITGSDSPSPVRGEKEAIATPAPAPTSKPAADQSKGKEPVAEMDVDNDARSETEKGDNDMTYDDPAEQLPEYQEEPQRQDEDEDEDEDEEGEYVKIDVK